MAAILKMAATVDHLEFEYVKFDFPYFKNDSILKCYKMAATGDHFEFEYVKLDFPYFKSHSKVL